MAKMFSGKEDPAEEMAEAKAVRSGKLSPKQYAAKEKAEGHKTSSSALEAKGKKLASGALSPQQYASEEKMANGGKVRKCANGGFQTTQRVAANYANGGAVGKRVQMKCANGGAVNGRLSMDAKKKGC